MAIFTEEEIKAQRLINLFKVTQVVCGRARTGTQTQGYFLPDWGVGRRGRRWRWWSVYTAGTASGNPHIPQVVFAAARRGRDQQQLFACENTGSHPKSLWKIPLLVTGGLGTQTPCALKRDLEPLL